MVTQKMTKVYSAGHCLQAVAVQNTLEMAGIQVSIRRSDEGYDVFTPSASAPDARELLNPEPRTGEIFYAPASPALAGEA